MTKIERKDLTQLLSKLKTSKNDAVEDIIEVKIDGKENRVHDRKSHGLVEVTIEGELDDTDDREQDDALEGSMLVQCGGTFGATLSLQFPN